MLRQICSRAKQLKISLTIESPGKLPEVQGYTRRAYESLFTSKDVRS